MHSRGKDRKTCLKRTRVGPKSIQATSYCRGSAGRLAAAGLGVGSYDRQYPRREGVCTACSKHPMTFCRNLSHCSKNSAHMRQGAFPATGSVKSRAMQKLASLNARLQGIQICSHTGKVGGTVNPSWHIQEREARNQLLFQTRSTPIPIFPL